MEFSNPIYKMNFFSSKTHISTPFAQDLRNESDFSENEIPDLNSLKPFEFEPKQTAVMLTVVAVLMRKKVLDIK